jgi:thiol-disulfide isomerase/thioredoxin
MLRVAYLHLFRLLVHHLCMSLKCSNLRGIIVFAIVFALPAGAQVELIDSVRAQAAHGSFSVADAQLKDYKAAHGVTPEYLEALSWVARGAAAMQQWNQALTYARETRTLGEQQLTKRKLDSEPHLPTALGAAYEVQAEALAGLGKSNEAVALLRSALTKYGTTSIAPRLRKNLNLITFVGKTAPALQAGQFLGPKPPTLASLKGSPVLLFFWAHWCVDCKGEAPIIARLRQEFAPQGLVVIGPTQFYGYAAQGNDATPDQERTYIEAVRQRFYSNLLDMPVPLSKQNFTTYGASTTPTLVVLDRSGDVAMYHPGAMSYADLRSALEKAVAR